MATKRALIIGVSGQDGSYLAQFLLQKGYKVTGASRDAMLSSFSNLRHLGVLGEVELESVSLNDFRSVLQVLKKCQPDEVYNLAGQSSVGLSFEMPVETFESISVGVLNLLEAIRFLERPTRLYNASSSECFGNTEGHPATESTSFQPRSPYAVAKAAAFWQVANHREAYGMYACSGLLFNHESPLRPDRFVTRKIVKTACRIAAGKEKKLRLGSLSVQRDWGWAPEYVEAMWMMLQQDLADDYIIATGQTSSLQDFVKETFDRLGMDWHEYVEHNPDLIRPTDIQISLAKPEKAHRQLGWKARYAMRDVVRLMVEEELAVQ
jgi:GDPmannose 4,6-dehydratase